jgi:hypothetical protein
MSYLESIQQKKFSPVVTRARGLEEQALASQMHAGVDEVVTATGSVSLGQYGTVASAEDAVPIHVGLKALQEKISTHGQSANTKSYTGEGQRPVPV